MRTGRLALLASLLIGGLVAGCGFMRTPVGSGQPAELTPQTISNRMLRQLPAPKGKIVAAVYGLRDQTGQFKQAPDSSFSTAVSQGAASLLVKALLDSQWFIPVERENLQNLLTERRVIRAIDPKEQPATNQPPLSPLLAAKILIEGGIVGYEMNVRTGGAGYRILGLGADMQYRMDQVTVNLRAIDVNTGRILHSVMTTKTIFSHQVDVNSFKFVSYQTLEQAEIGYSQNEPAQLCLMDAIESAVGHLIIAGVLDRSWVLDDPNGVNDPIFQEYRRALEHRSSAPPPVSK